MHELRISISDLLINIFNAVKSVVQAIHFRKPCQKENEEDNIQNRVK
jgi:hypothetical protein